MTGRQQAPGPAVVATAMLWMAIGAPAAADSPAKDSVDIFLRSNKLWFRVPDGPEYRASIRSPEYESYAADRAAGCARPPEPTERTEVLQFYKPREGGNSGRLHLELLVDPAGRPVAVQLLESPGALAVYSAVHALRSWRFDPGRTVDGEPTYCRYEILFQFVLAEG